MDQKTILVNKGVISDLNKKRLTACGFTVVEVKDISQVKVFDPQKSHDKALCRMATYLISEDFIGSNNRSENRSLFAWFICNELGIDLKKKA